MTSLTSKLVAVLFFFGLVAVIGTNAQLPANGIDFKAPFPFVIGTSNLPAGDYSIQPSQGDPGVLNVNGPSGHSILAYCEDVDLNSPATKSEVTFRKYGTGATRFLTQITVGGSAQGCAFASSDTEKKAKKSGSASKDVVEGKAK